MRYTITATDDNGAIVSQDTATTPNAASELAAEMARRYPTAHVYVDWYRASDGQHGYLNPGCDHAITGVRWGHVED